MKNLIRLSDYSKEEIFDIFKIADEVSEGKYKNFFSGKTVVMFFPNSSIRTRMTFEKGVSLLGGHTILFSPETLDKKEDIKDVIGYLNNWADVLIVRHRDINLIEKIGMYSACPVINAMTNVNHPCEMISDMYALSKIRDDFTKDNYLFCGANGNIGLAWKEASEVMGFSFSQCCPKGYEIGDVNIYNDVLTAVMGKDVICTDSLSKDNLSDFKDFQITTDVMERANEGAILNPCPPFYRGEEVSEEVIDSKYFVGYGFKKYLLEIQQAIIIYNMM